MGDRPARRSGAAALFNGERHLNRIADLLGLSVDDLRRQAVRSPDSGPRLLYESSNGDRWTLMHGPLGEPLVRHVANPAAGGCITDRGVGAFLAVDPGSPQHVALLRLVEELLLASLAGP